MSAEGLQKRLQTEVEKYKLVQKDYQKFVQVRQQLEGQLNENTMVKDELERLEANAPVYKMMGPVLVKQDNEEAKATVQKRIDYINTEIKRNDVVIKDIDTKKDSTVEMLTKLQHQYQQAQLKAAAKA